MKISHRGLYREARHHENHHVNACPHQRNPGCHGEIARFVDPTDADKKNPWLACDQLFLFF